MFTQEAERAALIFALTENQNIAIDLLLGEAVLVHRAYFLIIIIIIIIIIIVIIIIIFIQEAPLLNVVFREVLKIKMMASKKSN